MKLLKYCTAKLDEVEKKIEILVKDKSGKVTGSKPFKNDEEQDKLL